MEKSLFYFDNFTPKCSSTYVGTESTVVDSGRNVSGVVIGSVVRESVCAIDATWNYISVEDWAKILQQFNSKYGGSFYRRVTFFNQVSANWESKTFYVGDRTTAGLIVLDHNGNPRGWQNAKLSLVER